MKQNIKKQLTEAKGFTIIEVALVLAIAGLIFLVVFLAWPALQNSQKDTAARQDVNHIVTAVASFKSDNQGTLPTQTDITGTGGAIWKYATASGSTKLSQATSIAQGTITSTTSATGASRTTIGAAVGAACPGTNAPASSTVAVFIQLSSGTYYCENAQ